MILRKSPETKGKVRFRRGKERQIQLLAPKLQVFSEDLNRLAFTSGFLPRIRHAITNVLNFKNQLVKNAISEPRLQHFRNARGMSTK